MNHFLNIVCENYENMTEECYINSVIPSNENRYEYVMKLMKNIHIKNVRKSKIDDNLDNLNDYYYYFITHLHNLNNLKLENDFFIFNSHLRSKLISDDNFIIVLVDEFSIGEKLKNIFSQLKISLDKLIILNPNELNIKFIDNLRNHPKKSFNIVYDKWSDDFSIYYPNLHPAKKDYIRYRIVVGLFRFYGFFNEIRNCILEEVYENPTENYFYFINGDNFNHHVNLENTLPIPDTVKKCFNECNNFNIMILNEHEYESEEFIIKLNKILNFEKYDCTRIYMLNNNSKLEHYKNIHEISYNVFSLDFLVKFISTHMVEFGVPTFIPEKRGDFFLCHNRSPKPHRYALLCKMKKGGLLNDTDWSLIMGWYHKKQKRDVDSNFLLQVFDRNEINNHKEEINFFNKIDIKKSKYEEEKTWFDDTGDNAQIFWNNVYVNRTYEETYVNIITESCFFDKEIHITEKSMKPFYFYQLPIFLSSYNHVKFLKERFGFDMFDDIINHDYDDEYDNKLRLQKVYNEILRIYKNKETIKEFYKNNKIRFENNHKIVTEIQKSDRDKNFFKSLINKTI